MSTIDTVPESLPAVVDAAPATADPITLLREVLAQADTQRANLAAAGDGETIARAIPLLKALYGDLATLIRSCEDDVVAWMPDRKVEIDGLGVLERKKATDRRQWDSERLLGIVARIALDPDATGEIPADPIEVLDRLTEAITKAMPITGSLGWRVTALREMGLDPDDYCEATPGRVGLQIHGGDAR